MALVALLCEARVVGELETLRFLGTTSTRSGEKPAGDLKFSEAGRCERSETDGFMKVFVDADTERFLGAAFLGIGGDEIVHGILDIMYADQPYTTIARAVHIHPTVSELIPTLLQSLKPLEE